MDRLRCAGPHFETYNVQPPPKDTPTRKTGGTSARVRNRLPDVSKQSRATVWPKAENGPLKMLGLEGADPDGPETPKVEGGTRAVEEEQEHASSHCQDQQRGLASPEGK